MTEAEWLASTDPVPMVRFLDGVPAEGPRRPGTSPAGQARRLTSRPARGKENGNLRPVREALCVPDLGAVPSRP
jgi:hypothetical protein